LLALPDRRVLPAARRGLLAVSTCER
jgi:hypothetical protein